MKEHHTLFHSRRRRTDGKLFDRYACRDLGYVTLTDLLLCLQTRPFITSPSSRTNSRSTAFGPPVSEVPTAQSRDEAHYCCST